MALDNGTCSRTLANMPGRSAPPLFVTWSTALTVRVVGSSSALIRSMLPVNRMAGYAAMPIDAPCPMRRKDNARSGTWARTSTTERSARRNSGVPASTADPASACASTIVPENGATMGSSDSGSPPLHATDQRVARTEETKPPPRRSDESRRSLRVSGSAEQCGATSGLLQVGLCGQEDRT